MQKAADLEELQMAVIASLNYTTGEVVRADLVANLKSGWQVSQNAPYTCTSPSGNTFTVTAGGIITEEGAGGGETEDQDLAYLTYAPVAFISAKTGQRVDKLFSLINQVAEQNALRVSTSVLNQVLAEAVAVVQPPTDKGKRLKIFYMTQASTKPPTFVVFVNDKKLFHFSYERYLVNQLRKEFGLQGTPVRIICREKKG